MDEISVPARSLSRGSLFSQWLIQFVFFYQSRILAIFSQTIRDGLCSGLTKTEVEAMRNAGAYFSSPLHFDTQILAIRLRLEILRFLSWLLRRERLSYRLRRVLDEFVNSASDSWNPSLLPAMASESTGSFELFLYVIPSPFGFDWGSPRRLFWSLRNYLCFYLNHKIGHAFVVLKKNGEVVAATGMTGETNYQAIFSLFAQGSGLDALFRVFRGRLQCGRFVLQDIEKHCACRHIRERRFELTEEKFKKCLARLRDWCESGRYSNYGLAFDASDLSGASCTSYAVGFLHESGLLTEAERSKWLRTVTIPEKFFSSAGRRIGLFKLLAMLLWHRQWKTSQSEFRTLRFWDPDLMSGDFPAP